MSYWTKRRKIRKEVKNILTEIKQGEIVINGVCNYDYIRETGFYFPQAIDTLPETVIQTN